MVAQSMIRRYGIYLACVLLVPEISSFGKNSSRRPGGRCCIPDIWTPMEPLVRPAKWIKHFVLALPDLMNFPSRKSLDCMFSEKLLFIFEKYSPSTSSIVPQNRIYPPEYEGHLGELMISNEDIRNRVRELAELIHKDYDGIRPVMICTLKGACPVRFWVPWKRHKLSISNLHCSMNI